MSSRKIHTCLLLIALVSCFMMPAFADEEEAGVCSVCLYTKNTNDPHDPSKGACFNYPQSGTFYDTTPFVGQGGKTVTGFFYVGLSGCDSCTFTAYKTPSKMGKSTVINGHISYSYVTFCARSFELDCRGGEEGGEEGSEG